MYIKNLKFRDFGVDFEAHHLLPEFSALENVMIPAAGLRGGSPVGYVGGHGYYWSSTAFDSLRAYLVLFDSYAVSPNYYGDRDFGYSVRLITECQ